MYFCTLFIKQLMTMKRFIFLCLLCLPSLSMAQEQPSSFSLHLSGFVKNDFFFDTHKTLSLREGAFYLYPENVKLDKEGVDINAHASFNILAIYSRLHLALTGPEAFGAKTSAVVEGDFFGSQEGGSNGFRMRYAYCKMSWQTTDVIFGQTDHGFFNTDCMPEIMAVNTGAPYQPLSRNPQIKVVQRLDNFRFLLSIMSQRDFSSWGGSDALRNATLPELNLCIKYNHLSADSAREILIGAGADYKILVPRLVTDSNLVTNTDINNYAFQGFFKYRCKAITLKLEATYGQNLYDQGMLGGYAYKYTTDSTILARGDFNYTSLNTLAAWMDIATNGKKVQFGIFGGYTKNMGSLSNIFDWNNSASFFARGRTIDYVYRVSPRVVFISGKMKMGLEGDYSVAGYGTSVNSLGEVQGVKAVSNIRLTYSVYYIF